MVTHLGSRDNNTACGSFARFPTTTSRLNDVTCTRCPRGLIEQREHDWAQAHLAQQRATCVAMGLGPIWDHLTVEDTPSGRMTRQIMGSLAMFLQETGYTPPS